MHRSELDRLPIHNPFGADALFVSETESTMSLARKIASPKNGCVIVAGHQSAGRGRLGNRVWHDTPNESLLCTLILDQNEVPRLLELPIRAGLAVARTVEELCSRRALLKWPNDVLVDGCKVSGILCESDGGRVYVGIGLNCNQVEFPKDMDLDATSIRLIRGESVSVNDTLEKTLANVHRSLTDLEWRAESESRLYLAGRRATIRVTANEETEPVDWVVTIRGIGEDGSLRVSLEDGSSRQFYVGEVGASTPLGATDRSFYGPTFQDKSEADEQAHDRE